MTLRRIAFDLIHQLCLVIAAIGAIVVWIPADPPNLVTWAMRLLFPLATAALAWPLVRRPFRPEKLPDLLNGVARSYFERDGLCFAFVPSVVDGVSWMNVYFQNRYENPCRSRIMLRPRRPMLRRGRPVVPDVDVTVECDGGAFGVSRLEWPIPATLQGRTISCGVTATTRYPDGAGRLLRFRSGLRVAPVESEFKRIAVTTLLDLAGMYSSGAVARFQLPRDVAETPSLRLNPQCEIRWRPKGSARPFPVVSRTSTAR